ncbi:uncharacterized protein LOC114740196 [Neltuma alba]|uniref:uncharacterized protein LOC114740196 n=1 Tax=Neltuma alba TaxID=207710 RepID=UPI0010A44F34|nr:uncharacterized protein LOC114740196 [Prosopis alba]
MGEFAEWPRAENESSKLQTKIGRLDLGELRSASKATTGHRLGSATTGHRRHGQGEELQARRRQGTEQLQARQGTTVDDHTESEGTESCVSFSELGDPMSTRQRDSASWDRGQGSGDVDATVSATWVCGGGVARIGTRESVAATGGSVDAIRRAGRGGGGGCGAPTGIKGSVMTAGGGVDATVSATEVRRGGRGGGGGRRGAPTSIRGSVAAAREGVDATDSEIDVRRCRSGGRRGGRRRATIDTEGGGGGGGAEDFGGGCVI